MITRVTIPIALILSFALIVPAFAGGSSEKPSKARAVAGSLYQSGAAALEQTESALTACLSRTFTLFNPCLDLVKGCTGLVLSPIHGSIDYVAGAKAKPKPPKATPKPADTGKEGEKEQ